MLPHPVNGSAVRVNFSGVTSSPIHPCFSTTITRTQTCGRAAGFPRRWCSIAERRLCKRTSDTLNRQRCGLRALPFPRLRTTGTRSASGPEVDRESIQSFHSQTVRKTRAHFFLLVARRFGCLPGAAVSAERRRRLAAAAIARASRAASSCVFASTFAASSSIAASAPSTARRSRRSPSASARAVRASASSRSAACTLNRGGCFHPLCVIERLVFGVFEPSDERRLLR